MLFAQMYFVLYISNGRLALLSSFSKYIEKSPYARWTASWVLKRGGGGVDAQRPYQLKKDCTASGPRSSTCCAPNGPTFALIPPVPMATKTSPIK